MKYRPAVEVRLKLADLKSDGTRVFEKKSVFLLDIRGGFFWKKEAQNSAEGKFFKFNLKSIHITL